MNKRLGLPKTDTTNPFNIGICGQTMWKSKNVITF